MKLPCFGDFEASGLDEDSFPIEVAWSLSTGEIHSYLICPEPDWTHWDDVAEGMHGISLETLREKGKSPAEITDQMNHDLDRETLYFDGGDYDKRWLSRLFQAASMRPTFMFGDFDMLLARILIIDENRREAAEARARADIGDLPLHRAANDVKFLQRWYINARRGMRL